jgi:hypothetical protein
MVEKGKAGFYWKAQNMRESRQVNGKKGVVGFLMVHQNCI